MTERHTPQMTFSAESNLDYYPFFVMGRHKQWGEANLHHEREVTLDNPETGERTVVSRSWTVRPSHELGFPGRGDQDIYTALLEIVWHRGGMPEDGVIEFRAYELAKVLGWDTSSGRNHKRIVASLERMASTTIRSRNAFYSVSADEYVSDTFSIFSYHLRERHEKLRGRRRDVHSVRFHPLFVANYWEGYLDGLNIGFYKTLEDSMSKRMFRLLQSRADEQNRKGNRLWSVDLFELRDLVPLAKYRYTSKIKEKLALAHRELRAKGFLKDVSYEMRDGREVAVYTINRGFAGVEVRNRIEREPANGTALREMQKLGVPREVRCELIERYGGETCRGYAELVPYQQDVRNPVGFLRKALAEGWELVVPKHMEYRAAESVTEDRPPRKDYPEQEPDRRDDGKGEVPERPLPSEPQESKVDQTARRLVEHILAGSGEDSTEPSSLHGWMQGYIPVGLREEGASTVLLLRPVNEHARDYWRERLEDRFLCAAANVTSSALLVELV